uniref:Uncharacterized protein n=1 Tax=Archaeoglobus fulgidus TaxID=2234 RepID=A0A7J2TI96_ARCFL
MPEIEEVKKELEFWDPLDRVLLLSIGPNPASHTEIQKRAVVISSILGIDLDVEPYEYGLYSETITEKLSDERNSVFFVKKGRFYELTEKGKMAWKILTEKLDREILEFIDALYKMDRNELLALVYHLFPSSFTKSKIGKKILAAINKYKNRGFVKVRREGDKVILEV